jgi:hypothetical protein
MDQELAVTVDGEQRTVTPSPSLATLCATMQQRGDPSLAATWVLPVN